MGLLSFFRVLYTALHNHILPTFVICFPVDTAIHTLYGSKTSCAWLPYFQSLAEKHIFGLCYFTLRVSTWLTFPGLIYMNSHGIITIKTPNPKCRHYWCLMEFIDWRYSQSWLKGTQDWEFFWLRIWILYYFIVSYAQTLRFCKKNFLIGPRMGEIRLFRLVWD